MCKILLLTMLLPVPLVVVGEKGDNVTGCRSGVVLIFLLVITRGTGSSIVNNSILHIDYVNLGRRMRKMLNVLLLRPSNSSGTSCFIIGFGLLIWVLGLIPDR